MPSIATVQISIRLVVLATVQIGKRLVQLALIQTSITSMASIRTNWHKD